MSAPSITRPDVPLLVRLLLESGALAEDALEKVGPARQRQPSSLERALVEGEIATEQQVATAYATFLKLPWMEVQLEGDAHTVVKHAAGDGGSAPLGPLADVAKLCEPLARKVTESTCRRHRVVPMRETKNSLVVGCTNPTDFVAIEEVRMHAGKSVYPAVMTVDLVDMLLDLIFGERDEVREIAQQSSGETAKAKASDEAEDEMEFVLDLQRPINSGKDSQVIRIVNVLLQRAIEEGASDIHIEPYEDEVRVRYRIDGKLRETTPPPRSLFVPTISRLKILAKMDIAEKRIPQDGAIALKSGDQRVDLRVSTVPTVYGEKMVIRILAKGGIPDKLQKLGFSEKQAGDFLQAAHSPHGLMFVTGPTGSGKATTLYCCLNLINSPHENIMTVEDPVEYKFHGLNQVHVRSNVGLTFAATLRSFLRQDPDKIMVGEVRDQETAQICMRAALTGHLVLSTLHTNNSLQVINRLVDMGIEPFLLGPALRLLEAQRLLRRLCQECKQPYEVPDDVCERFGLPAKTVACRPKPGGCPTCRGTGMKGRTGVYEVIPITDHLRELICSRAPVAEVEKTARAEGHLFLDDAARRRLIDGQAPLEEVAEYVRTET